MKIEDVLVPKNIGKRFKFNLNEQEVVTEVKGYYTCGYQKIVLDFIDEIDFEEVEREIDWSRVPKFTKVVVEGNSELLKSKEFNRYFLEKTENGFNTASSLPDKFTGSSESGLGTWDKCRIHPSVEVKEEWYKEKDIVIGEEDDIESLY